MLPYHSYKFRNISTKEEVDEEKNHENRWQGVLDLKVPTLMAKRGERDFIIMLKTVTGLEQVDSKPPVKK